MKRIALGMMTIAICSLGVPGCESAASPEDATQAFFSQFHEDYEAPVTVARRIAQMGLGPEILDTSHILSEDGLDSSATYALRWWQGQLDVMRDDASIDAEVDSSDPKRIRWKDDSDAGWITAGPEGTLIFQINNTRIAVRPPMSDAEWSKTTLASRLYWWKVMMSSTCVCFGKGTTTKHCAHDDCNEGVSCGTTRACRWKAGY